MKRWHDDYYVTIRQWKKHYRWHVRENKDRQTVIGQDPYDVDCDCDKQIGRFRKKDAFDCGNTRCYICHGDKLPKRSLTKQELLADMALKEQIAELA